MLEYRYTTNDSSGYALVDLLQGCQLGSVLLVLSVHLKPKVMYNEDAKRWTGKAATVSKSSSKQSSQFSVDNSDNEKMATLNTSTI